jgi:hypothetical protein
MLTFNLTEIIESYTLKQGYSILNVKNLNGTHISITQVKTSEAYYVPFTFLTAKVGSLGSLVYKFNTSNLFNKIIWLSPNDVQSKS